MSASPAERTPSMTPNGTPRPLIIRRPKPADPLVRPRLQKKRPNPTSTTIPSSTSSTNGTMPSRPVNLNKLAGVTQPPFRIAEAQSTSLNLLKAAVEPIASGFTDAKPGTYVDYPLVISKRALLEGLRPHVARFASKQDVDPSNEAEFTRPVRLHRRDPKAPPPGSKPEGMDAKDTVMEEEMEKQELIKAQRDARRQAELAEIAPSVNNPNAKRGGAAQKKTQQILRKDETEEQRAGTRLKYEEALPWHIEDFDNKQTWVGSYEAALSETYAQIAFDDGKFSVTPIEKWYKFTQKRNFRTQEELTADSQKREKKLQDPQWLVRQRELDEKRQTEEMYRRVTKGLYVGKTQDHLPAKASRGTASIKKEADDNDELDFEEDIADDEEDPVYEGDVDETKETQTRIKRDQLQANIFDLKDEKAYERDELREKKEKEALKVEGKRVRKVLMKRERNHIYDSDSEHAYSEQSESEDSETERRKEEELKKEAEEKKAEEKKSKSSQGTAGAPVKGSNTPSNRASKHPDPSKRTASNTLKRAGSPNASDASGNESSRKKQKKKHGTSSNLTTGVNTPHGPPSRSRSPMLMPPSSDSTSNRPNIQTSKSTTSIRPPHELKRSRPGAGSGSDGEAARSGGEMSDGTRKRIKLKMGMPGSKSGSPKGSRAASPTRGAASSGGSRAVSPDAIPQTWTAAQLKAAIPPSGITMQDLIKRFNLQRGAMYKPQQESFIALVKTVSVLEKGTKLLMPKED